MNHTRKRPGSKAILLSLAVVVASLGLLASAQVWVRLELLPGAATVEALDVTGQDMNAAVTLISLAVLAAVLVLTIAGKAFRRVIGVLIALLGVGLALTGMREPLEGASTKLEEVSGISGDAQAALLNSMTVTSWPGVTIGIGALLVLVGIAVTVLSPRWKQGGRKYEAASEVQRKRVPGAATGDRISDWEALSDGDDPTDFEDDDEPEDASGTPQRPE